MEIEFEKLHIFVQVLMYLGAFGFVALASGKIAGVLQKLKLPLVLERKTF